MKAIRVAAAAACIACVGAVPAQAHVTIHPNVLPAGGFSVVDVRVPNERDKASTTKVDVQFPAGFIFVSTQPVPGWSAKVITRKLAEPVEIFGEKHSEETDRVVFTASGKGVEPGQFVEFPLSVRTPDKVKSPLTFKALQTYSNGEVVRWIGAPDAEKPAPQVAIVGENEPISDLPAGVAGAGAGHGASGTAEPAGAAAAEEGEEDEGASMALVIAALILGTLGLAVGTAGFIAARRAAPRVT